MISGFSSRPAMVSAQFVTFLTDRLGMGLYPQGISEDPWRIEYAQNHSQNIWRPLLPVGAYRDAGPHPLFRRYLEGSCDVSNACGRVGSHIVDGSLVFVGGRHRSFSEAFEDFEDLFERMVLVEWDLAMQLCHHEPGRDESPISQATSRVLKTYPYCIEQSTDPDHETDWPSMAMMSFQGISLALNHSSTRHHAVDFMWAMIENYESNDAMAKRVVEDHLRMAWALLTSEPEMEHLWKKAAQHLTWAASRAWVEPDMLESGLPQQIDAFQEEVWLLAQSGEGLQSQKISKEDIFLAELILKSRDR